MKCITGPVHAREREVPPQRLLRGAPAARLQRQAWHGHLEGQGGPEAACRGAGAREGGAGAREDGAGGPGGAGQQEVLLLLSHDGADDDDTSPLKKHHRPNDFINRSACCARFSTVASKLVTTPSRQQGHAGPNDWPCSCHWVRCL